MHTKHITLDPTELWRTWNLQANGEFDTQCGLTFQEICLDDLYLHNVQVGYGIWETTSHIDDEWNENIFSDAKGDRN